MHAVLDKSIAAIAAATCAVGVNATLAAQGPHRATSQRRAEERRAEDHRPEDRHIDEVLARWRELGRVEAPAVQWHEDGSVSLRRRRGAVVEVVRCDTDHKLHVEAAGKNQARPTRAQRPQRASQQTAQRRGAARGKVFVRDHNVWLRGSGDERALSSAGTAEDPCPERAHVAPDGKTALVFRGPRREEHLIHVVESAPRGTVQPKLHSFQYTKPGDRIDEVRPVLFDLEAARPIEVEREPFAKAWSITRPHWSADGRELFCLFNERGHQRLAVYAIDRASGKVRTLVDERSATFIDYSQKTELRWLANGQRFLWMSERDGWNHLYLGDARPQEAGGAELRQLTRGNFVVKQVLHVDEARGEVYFSAYGLHADQDPYHLHLARVALAGGAIAGSTVEAITKRDGTHEWWFAPDHERVVVRWSRVDHPPVTELVDVRSGEVLKELDRVDMTELLAQGFAPPERFHAPGRDGQTAIHGILIRPSHFDPAKRYPVLESIYAGPHGQHVPTAWSLGLRQRKLAELGFVVVQIDGMGTNWRDKRFHDVCWRNLKDAGLPDRIAWLRAAQNTRPWLDLERVGIFGGSAGGQNALAALLPVRPSRILSGSRSRLRLPRQPHGQDLVERSLDGLARGPALRGELERDARGQAAWRPHADGR